MNSWVPFFGLLSLPVMLAGLVCLIRPTAKIRIPTRKRAAIVFVCGLAAFIIAMNVPYSHPQHTTAKPEMASNDTPAKPARQPAPPVEPAKPKETEAPSSAFAEAEAAYSALAICEQEAGADCSKQKAAADRAQAAWDRKVDQISKEVDARAGCIKRQLGNRFDDATTPEILAARKKCGIDDPEDTEEQLRRQRELLSR